MKYKETKSKNNYLLLIDKIKVLVDNLPSWMVSRKRLLIFIIIDIFIFLSISLIYQSNFNILLISILLIWIISSYISNRYNVEKFQNIKRIKYKRKCLKNTSFALTLSLFYIIIISYFLKDYIVIKNQIYLNSQYYSYILLLIIFSFISLLSQYLIRKILSFYDTKDSKLLYYGSEITLQKIRFYSK